MRVVEAHLRQDALQIVDVHPRSEALAAARHSAGSPVFACRLVELHAELRGTLENVKELPERQIEQRGNHGDGVQDREKAVELPRSQSCETVSASPVTEIANSRMSGRKSSAKVCTACAPRSRKRRHSERAIPPSTSIAAISRP